METFIAFCAGIAVCIIATIPGEREYGRLMYRRGYSQALEDVLREYEEYRRQQTE